MIEETQEILKQRLDALVEGLNPNDCEKLFLELAEYVILAKYGFVLSDDMKELNPGAFDRTTTIQSINGGKAILISPKGFEVVSEENVGSNGCYRVTLRERKKSSFEGSVREGNVPHLERGGFIKRHQSRKR